MHPGHRGHTTVAPDFLSIAKDIFAALKAPDVVITTERGGRMDYIFVRTNNTLVEIGYEPFSRLYCFASLADGKFGRIGGEANFPAGESLARGEISENMFAAHEQELRRYLEGLLQGIREHLSS